MRQSWKVDSDYWLVRPAVARDSVIIGAYGDHAFVSSGHVFCRSLGIARALDRGDRPAKRELDTLLNDEHAFFLDRRRAYP